MNGKKYIKHFRFRSLSFFLKIFIFTHNGTFQSSTRALLNCWESNDVWKRAQKSQTPSSIACQCQFFVVMLWFSKRRVSLKERLEITIHVRNVANKLRTKSQLYSKLLFHFEASNTHNCRVTINVHSMHYFQV